MSSQHNNESVRDLLRQRYKCFKQTLLVIFFSLNVSWAWAQPLLLIPESTNDRIMAFDPFDGSLISPDFIPADPDNLSTPINAVILSATGNSILVSDQIDDVVQEYALDGSYIGVFAPAGGVDNSILDNIRGISLRPNGNLLVTVANGSNADAIAEFDTDGNYLGNFIANGAGGLDSPFDVLIRKDDVLVGGITSDAIHRYDLSGNSLGTFSQIDTFPEQLSQAANGNILVANHSGTQEGIIEYSPDGNTILGSYNPAGLVGYRGVFELGNGNILTTTSSGVHEIDRLGNLVETEISGVSARFIELANLCLSQPQGMCNSADHAKSGLNISRKGQVRLSLRSGDLDASHLPDPTVDNGHSVCIYNGTQLILSSYAAPGEAWKLSKNETVIRFKNRSTQGIQHLIAKAEKNGRSNSFIKTLIKSKLALPIGVNTLLTAQITGDNGSCIEASWDPALGEIRTDSDRKLNARSN